jgi:hypothetical protein
VFTATWKVGTSVNTDAVTASKCRIIFNPDYKTRKYCWCSTRRSLYRRGKGLYESCSTAACCKTVYRNIWAVVSKNRGGKKSSRTKTYPQFFWHLLERVRVTRPRMGLLGTVGDCHARGRPEMTLYIHCHMTRPDHPTSTDPITE